MLINIPLQPINDQLINIVLNNQNCTIRLFQANNNFYVDFYLNDTALILGAKGIIGKPVLWNYTSYNFIGNLYFYNPNLTLLNDFTQLGSNIFLYYSDKIITLDNISSIINNK